MALSKNNHGYAVADNKKLSEMSFMDLNAMFQMAISISNGRYHPDYKRYYKSVLEEIREHFDYRVQNKLFHTSNPQIYFNHKRGMEGLEEINIIQ